MKKLIAASIAALLMTVSSVNTILIPANAAVVEDEIIAPCYLYTDKVTSSISISGTTAIINSEVYAYSSATKIYITQYLQKKSGSSWTQVGSGHTGVYYSKSASMTNTVSSLSSGTYRVKTVAKVFSGTSYETITNYSTTDSL